VDLSTGRGTDRIELTSDDAEWAREAFARMSDAFFAKVRAGKWCVEGRHQSLVIYRLGTRIAPRNWKAYVGEAAELASEFFAASAGAQRTPSIRFTFSV
jgi:hypothetical protein